MNVTNRAKPMPYAIRVIRVAAALDTRYGNPEVCAFNRKRTAKSDQLKAFWHEVFNVLDRPYYCQTWLQSEMLAWDAIRAEQRRTAKEVA